MSGVSVCETLVEDKLVHEGGKNIESRVEECLDGSLCRCTGYRPVLDGVKSGSARALADPTNHKMVTQRATETLNQLFNYMKVEEEMQKSDAHPLVRLAFTDGLLTWVRPRDHTALLDLMHSNRGGQGARLQAGGSYAAQRDLAHGANAEKKGLTVSPTPIVVTGYTGLGYSYRYHPDQRPHGASPPLIVASMRLASATERKGGEVKDIREHEMERCYAVKEGESGGYYALGTAATLAETREFLEECIERDSTGVATRGALALIKQMRFFANDHVRNMGTMGGSLAAGDKLSDIWPVLAACNASVIAESRIGGRRVISLREHQPLRLEEGELITQIRLPKTSDRDYVEAFKHAKRRTDSQALCNAGMYLRLNKKEEGCHIEECRIHFGCISNIPAFRASRTEEVLAGTVIGDSSCAERILGEAMGGLRLDIQDAVQSWDSSENCPASLHAQSLPLMFLYCFLSKALSSVGLNLNFAVETIPSRMMSDTREHKGCPQYSEASHGQALPHAEADDHVRGEAEYVGDRPFAADGLHAAPVMARGCGEVTKIHTDIALRVPGVVQFVGAADIAAWKGGVNKIGTVVEDEEVFATTSLAHGQLVGLVLAECAEAAREGARRVEVRLNDHSAIHESSTYEERCVQRGDAASMFRQAANSTEVGRYRLLEGTVSSGGQNHWYIEPMAVIVESGSGNSLNVHVTCQNPSLVQRQVARVLGIPLHRVHVNAARLGGGFGGKQDRPAFIAAAAAVACKRSGRPVRLVLEREEDMVLKGGRHPATSNYRCLVDTHKKVIVALDVDTVLFAGLSQDLSAAVLEVALLSMDGCYRINDVTCRGRLLPTSAPSNTAFRGFGKPQAGAIIETIMDHAAAAMGEDAVHLRQRMLMKAGDKHLDGFQMEASEEALLHGCWSALQEEYARLRKECAQFNQASPVVKRGVSLIPCKSNVGFDVPHMNQAGALVNIYTDGTVSITHGGVEMGQGIHTKIAQIAADALSIPVDMVWVYGTSSDSIPNTSPTAASSGTDLNGRAVIDACTTLKNRLQKYLQSRSDASESNASKVDTWRRAVRDAFLERVSLSTTGYCGKDQLPFEPYSFTTKKGLWTYYHIFSAALVQVELDTLSGSYRPLYAHIVQDCGKSVNPAHDVGQVEGGFVQGLGLYCLEELIYSKDGHLRSRNASTYKIPSHDDIPYEFKVTLLTPPEGYIDERAVVGTKAVSECGIQQAMAAVCAMRQAVQAISNKVEESSGAVLSHTPATAEVVQMECLRHHTNNMDGKPLHLGSLLSNMYKIRHPGS